MVKWLTKIWVYSAFETLEKAIISQKKPHKPVKPFCFNLQIICTLLSASMITRSQKGHTLNLVQCFPVQYSLQQHS